MSRFHRKAPVRKPATIIIVVTEGEKTEPQYLQMFKRIHVQPHVRRSVFDLKVISGVGVPKTVVDRAIQEREDLQGPLDREDSVWAMFDQDNHPGLEEAKRKARHEGVHLAFSNPCFEIWGIYHYEDCQRHIERDKCQKKLEELCSIYNRRSGKNFANEDIIRNKYRDAIKRAENSLNSRKKEGNPERGPSTSVHYLIETIPLKVEKLREIKNND